MKLYNFTDLPDNLLKRLLSSAARFVKTLKTPGGHKDTVVRVAWSGRGTHGQFHGWATIYRRWKRDGSYHKSDREIRCNGLAEIYIPRPSPYMDYLSMAMRVWEVMCHEFCHLNDHNIGRLSHLCRNEGEMLRRREWSRRPEEVSVFDQLYDLGIMDHHKPWEAQVRLSKTATDAIIELGIELESRVKLR